MIELSVRRAQKRVAHKRWQHSEKGRAWYRRKYRKTVSTTKGRERRQAADRRRYLNRRSTPDGLCKVRNSVASRQRELRRRRKLAVIIGYGGRCVCCGETEPAFLTIDHIDGTGPRPKGSRRKSAEFTNTAEFYLWLIRHNFPRDYFQLYCMNCNFGKLLNGGTCPHQAKERNLNARIA